MPDKLDTLNQAVNFVSIATLESAARIGAKLAVTFEPYRASIVEHLIATRLAHWEKEVRLGAADALAYVVEHAPGAITSEMVGRLSGVVISDDINKIHGHCQGLGAMLPHLDRSILKPVCHLLDSIIMDSHHFSNADKTSHLIRPAVLYLLNQFASFDNALEAKQAAQWSSKITKSGIHTLRIVKYV